MIRKKYNSLDQQETEYYVLGKTIESEVENNDATEDFDSKNVSFTN
jgi:hypothetical protein